MTWAGMAHVPLDPDVDPPVLPFTKMKCADDPDD